MVAQVCHGAVQATFERKGLEIVQFIHDTSSGDHITTLDEFVVKAIERQTSLTGTRVQHVRSVCLEVLRGAFYNSQPDERTYFQKLSRVYTLLLIIKNEPKVVEYFQIMTSQFILYVGSDILIRALSEHYLDEEDQMTCNVLRILSSAGSKLILTEKTLDEVGGNIRKANNSYRYEFQNREAYMGPEMARHIDHILLRAYFYVRGSVGVRKPAGWRDYVNQFADYDEIIRQENGSLREYLCGKLDMEYETRAEMESGIDKEALDDLQSRVMQVKNYRAQDTMLARNDALQVLRIYRRRKELSDRSGSNPFGYRVWWLTQESKIKAATDEVVRTNHGRYLMRPEFLVSFIDIVPNLGEVRRSFDSVFPSILGIRLSNRMNEADFLKVLSRYDEAAKVDPSRARVILANLSNKLKGADAREYDIKY